MASAKEHIDRLVQSMPKLCRILDEDLLEREQDSNFLWIATRHLSFISDKLNLGNEDLQEWLLQITSSISRAFCDLLDSLDLTGDIDSRLMQLEKSPEMLLEVERATWRTMVRRIEFQDEYLHFIQTLLLLRTKVQDGRDVSHIVKHLSRLYDNCRIKSKDASLSVNGSDYSSSYSSTDSDSDSDSDRYSSDSYGSSRVPAHPPLR